MALFDIVDDVLLAGMCSLWIGSVGAVWRDARARVSNPTATRVAVAIAALVPFAGALIWFCARPAETLAERREHRLRVRLAEQALGEAPVADAGDAPAAALVYETRDATTVAA